MTGGPSVTRLSEKCLGATKMGSPVAAANYFEPVGNH
jgi:hypothetical protein